ncbi:MAG: peptide chain release factor N(5)-glutamine methyltransferase [Salinarimonas sp.]|nr:peptide chain release factor N(5)-glutamine methyltransferase [Salinarimonas sp.]
MTIDAPHDTATRDSAPRATFMGLSFIAEGGVLKPRAETELLGREAQAVLARRIGAQVVVDMCCGCGNLAGALAHSYPSAFVYACDLTPETVAVAQRNMKELGLSDRVQVRRGDLFTALSGIGLEHRVDLVVCNPPYISSGRLERDRAHLLNEEPREAFDGGPYGISILQRMVRESIRFIKPGGWLAFEFGEGQERQAQLLIDRTKRFEPVSFACNEHGVPRVALARRRGDG